MEFITIGAKCPHCREPLTKVQIERTDVLERSAKGGFANTAQGSGVCRCVKCGKEIGGYSGGKNWGLWASED